MEQPSELDFLKDNAIDALQQIADRYKQPLEWVSLKQNGGLDIQFVLGVYKGSILISSTIFETEHEVFVPLSVGLFFLPQSEAQVRQLTQGALPWGHVLPTQDPSISILLTSSLSTLQPNDVQLQIRRMLLMLASTMHDSLELPPLTTKTPGKA